MRVVVQRVLESLGRAPRVAATIRHGHTPASLLISRLQASARQNDLTPTTTLWQRRSSVCARPYPSERKGHGGTSAASSTRPSSTSTGSATDDQDLQSPMPHPAYHHHRHLEHHLPRCSYRPPFTNTSTSTSIRRHQHHTTPRPTPTPNRRPNRRFLYRCWIYPHYCISPTCPSFRNDAVRPLVVPVWTLSRPCFYRAL